MALVSLPPQDFAPRTRSYNSLEEIKMRVDMAAYYAVALIRNLVKICQMVFFETGGAYSEGT